MTTKRVEAYPAGLHDPTRDRAVDFSPQAMAALETHPAFRSVVRRASALNVERSRGHWMLSRLLNDGGRFIASLMILDLHFSAGAGGGFTAAQLRREAVKGGLCSAGRITAFLVTLRLAGYLTAGTTGDRRTRSLVPTEALLAAHRDRWKVVFDLLAELSPDAYGAAAAVEDPTFLGHCAHVMMESYRDGRRILDYVPELNPLGQRDAGVTMLMSLLMLEPGRSSSAAELGRSFSVSQSHVRETMRLAERNELVCAVEGRGGFGPGPRLEEVIGRFFTMPFLVYLHAFRLAAKRGWSVGAAFPSAHALNDVSTSISLAVERIDGAPTRR